MDTNTVNAVIDHLAEKMAVPSAKLMELLPQIGIVDAMVFGIAVTVTLIALFVGILGARWGNDGVYIVSSIVGIIAGFLAIAAFADAVLWLYSPEAWALNYMLSKF